MPLRRLCLALLAGSGLAGCVAYPGPVAYEAPPPRPVYVAPPPAPVYVAPPPRPVYVAPAPRPAYVAPPPGRHWVPRRCDAYGRCWGGYWR